ncbi:alcohol dehydrogenase catalytic domain-containing protein [Actinopolymorpha sp. B11F2]|uniref:alcohol dehydrogenase catalytic domain-containing protein n=1 Tax=Actinopolymorpha sp. B11F2 TaxID=3160862 RepID=UPI0032E46AB3
MGIVEEVGDEVSQIRPGDRVVIPFNISCGHWFMCDHGLQPQCETACMIMCHAACGHAPQGAGGLANELTITDGIRHLIPARRIGVCVLRRRDASTGPSCRARRTIPWSRELSGKARVNCSVLAAAP